MTATELTSVERDGQRLVNYERTSSGYMISLALMFVAVYAWPVLDQTLTHWVRRFCDITTFIIWLVFLIDLIVRVVLSKRHLRYLLSHPLDVLIVALPILRPLRVIRVFTAGRTLINNTGRFPLMATSWAIGCVAGLLVFMGGVAVLDTERNAPGANITTPGKAFWWAAGTLTNVSHSINFPVTNTGKAVAITLTVLGLSLIGVTTAAIAAWFISQTRADVQNVEDQIEDRIDVLEAKIDAIHNALVTDHLPRS